MSFDGSEIAVVGLDGAFPGAPDLDTYWRNLESGTESVQRFSRAELLDGGEEASLVDDPSYVPARPVLEGVELFDGAFFGFTPREAEILDPQIRRFLECAFTALENAGHDPGRFPGRVSLFAGASFSNYLVHNLYKNRPVMEAFGDQQATIFNVPDSLVTTAGYRLDLKGACCAVQTFCSTSLVAVHLACQNLLGYESDLALAGGVSIHVPQKKGYLYEEGSILSRSGRVSAFDARADGTVFGNGVGVVVLRRLEDALSDGDTIHAVIRGSAINNDGSLKVSYAAPGVVGQTEVIVEALSAAGVSPDTIQYVEAHGTGTKLGDPAEVSALTRAFRTSTARTGFCGLGTVKANVGHLDAAAGVAGLIKVILALRHGRLPPSINFASPNPAIDFASSPFYVNATLEDWTRDGTTPRRAGVSAFGVGGTNAHVIVEEPPAPAPRPASEAPQLLVLSARTPSALSAVALRLADHLEKHPGLALQDVARTLYSGRRAFAHRRALVVSRVEDAIAALRDPAAGFAAVCERRNPAVVLGVGADPSLAGRLAAWGVAVAGEGTEPLVLEGKLEGLALAARLWLAGVELDWARVAPDPAARRVALPSYPFERERAWVEPLSKEAERKPLEWIYRPVWKRALPAPTAAPAGPERWLVLEDAAGLAAAVAERLRLQGHDVVAVRAGAGFGGDAATGYSLRLDRREDYAALFADLARVERLPSRVLHAVAVDAVAMETAVLSLVHLAAARPSGRLELHVLASQLFDVLGGEPIDPEKAALVPLCRVLGQEQHDLRCHLVDVDAADADAVAGGLAAGASPLVAYRRGRAWRQDFERLPAPAAAATGRVREGGVYLVTGGLGDVPFILELWLAKNLKAKLVLVQRTTLPPRETWAAWLAEHAADDAMAVRIQKVQALEALGSEVMLVAADVADTAAMKSAVAAARERFGALHGVIHAAGELAADMFVPAIDLTPERLARQFGPKRGGLLALDAALEGESLELFLLTSSISSVLGGLGYAAYAGANAYLDAWAARRSQAGDRSVMSIGWDQWEFEGRARQAARGGSTLKPHEGLAIFERLLAFPGVERVVVSTTPIDARLERWVELAESAPRAASQAPAGALRPRPALDSPLVAPRDETERVLVGIWQELLGIAPVGVHDDFFALGGHSLFAARVLSRVRAALDVALPVEAIFEAPTVAGLAERVAALRFARRPEPAEAGGDRVEIEL